MYFYQPPKSSIWGHRLGRLTGKQVLGRVERFLAKATGAHEFSNGVLSAADVSSPDAGLALELLAIAGKNPYQLDSATTLACVTKLIDWEEANHRRPQFVSVLQSCVIREWKTPSGREATESLINIHYGGMLPCISTFLRFGSIESFEAIQKVLSDVGLCKLNPKYLKPVRRAKQKVR
jgi:hypothetical protein